MPSSDAAFPSSRALERYLSPTAYKAGCLLHRHISEPKKGGNFEKLSLQDMMVLRLRRKQTGRLLWLEVNSDRWTGWVTCLENTEGYSSGTFVRRIIGSYQGVLMVLFSFFSLVGARQSNCGSRACARCRGEVVRVFIPLLPTSHGYLHKSTTFITCIKKETLVRRPGVRQWRGLPPAEA